MPGFNFYYNITSLSKQRPNDLICESITGDNFEVNRFTLNKFIDDKLFVEDEDAILVIEGAILNKAELLSEHEDKSWEELVWLLYKKDREFFKNLRGTFSGLIYDKLNEKWTVFTDQLASKHLYYYLNGSSLLVSSEITDIYDYFKESMTEYNLDTDAASMLLSYGYMLDDYTLCDKIKKLPAGSYISINDKEISFKNYYKLPLAAKEINLTEIEIIDLIDEKFRNAIKSQFDKDKEYGYRHLVALSGGLDSRMTSWVAHDMGYVNQLNFTFSQSDYLDETIPKKIAADLKHDWIFKALDNGIFLNDLDEINLMTGGNVLYYGLAHGNSMLKLINFDKLGVLHSGQLGDPIIGSYLSSLSEEVLRKITVVSSEMFLKEDTSNLKRTPEKIENDLIYQRGINGINSGLLAAQNYTETMSPFYDIEFFEFCLSIPIHLRMNHSLYKKWVINKYPKAAEYIWESTGRKITNKEVTIKYKGRNLPFSLILPKLLSKLGIKKSSIDTKHHMNPLDYWYRTNTDIKSFQDEYFKNNIKFIEIEKLRSDCESLYLKGNAIEKIQVLSLLAAIKLFFSNDH